MDNDKPTEKPDASVDGEKTPEDESLHASDKSNSEDSEQNSQAEDDSTFDEKKQKLVDAYDELAERAHQFYKESSDKTLAALELAIEKARDGLEKAGKISHSESQKLKEYLRRDVEQGAKFFDSVKEQASEKLQPGRVRANFLDLTSTLAHNASHLFDRLAEWADTTASFHTGQVTGPGVLKCRHCDKEMTFKKTGHIPPCPSCKKTKFRRIS